MIFREDLVALASQYIQPYTIARTSYVNHHPLIVKEARISSTMATMVHDVLIVGAGPGGLAIAARLREPTPSAVFTDAEHNRYQWVKKYSERMNLLPRGSGTARSKCSSTSRRNANGYGSFFFWFFRNIVADSVLGSEIRPVIRGSISRSWTTAAVTG